MAADDDDDDDEEETIHSPEELLAMLHSEEASLEKIVQSPEPRRLANFVQGTMFALMREMLRTMAYQASEIEGLDDLLDRSNILEGEALTLHLFINKTEALFDSGARELLPVLERDEFKRLLDAARRIVIRAEEEPGDDDDDEEDEVAAAAEGAPELQPTHPNGQGSP